MTFNYIETASARAFDFTCPAESTITVEDIAYALSNTNRWGGHSKPVVNVAQHSVMVARMLRNTGASVEVQLQGLMHDAAEAYVGDVATPIKETLKDYRELEQLVEHAIFAKFNIPLPLDPMVKRMDNECMLWEYRDLMPGGRMRPPIGNRATFQCWEPGVSAIYFIELFEDLQDVREVAA